MSELNLDAFTIICCGIIIIAFLISCIYISSKEGKEFNQNRKWIDQLPSFISTLGVLGTFLGITKGLIAFDTENLDKSIPVLLYGLKTAFFTSLCGMFGSLILNRMVSKKADKENTESEEIKAAKLIIEEIKKNHTSLTTLLNNNNTDIVKALGENDTIKAIRQDVEQLKDDIEEIKGLEEDLKSALGSIDSSNGQIVAATENLKSLTSNNAEEISRVRAVLVTATASISAIDNNVEDLNSTISGFDSTLTEICATVNDVQNIIEEKNSGEE